jgi:hypothetical protein
MVTSAAGGEYRPHGLMDEDGTPERYWTCLECGSLVGPMTKHRDLHDAWHARIAALSGP